MKFVIDTNALISALVRESASRRLILESELIFYSPDYLETEVERHKDLILKKSGLEKAEFESLVTLLLEEIRVLPIEDYERSLKEADEAIGEVDRKDVPFLACALASRSKIWSDDEHFEKQDLVKVWKTSRMMKEFL